MSTSKIVSQTHDLFVDHTGLTTSYLPDVSRPDRLSSAEIASVVQAAGLQGMFHISIYLELLFNFLAAVRKNRYVILPIDFEDAWKVCLFLFGSPHVEGIFVFLRYSTANGQTVGRDTRVL